MESVEKVFVRKCVGADLYLYRCVVAEKGSAWGFWYWENVMIVHLSVEKMWIFLRATLVCNTLFSD